MSRKLTYLMIVVIGAGPAGLALAHELQRRGLAYRVLEREAVGAAWKHHYKRLHLHTLKGVSALPGLPMPASYPAFPSAAQLQRYLERYAEHFGLNISTGVTLERADFDGMRWQLRTSGGMLAAETLVLATGIWSAPVRASLVGEASFGGPILHSRDYDTPDPFQGKRVLVVGAGNSGTEIAVDLAEHGVDAAIAVRSGVAFVPEPHSVPVVRMAAWLLHTLPRPLAGRILRRRDFGHLGLPLPPGSPLDHFPVVGYELPEAVAAGHVAVYGAVDRLAPGVVQFADGRRAPFDAIILATGYRPALEAVAHELELDARGRPLLDHRWRARGNPRLVCVGYTYPTTEGWLQAIGRVAQSAAAGIEELPAVAPGRFRPAP